MRHRCVAHLYVQNIAHLAANFEQAFSLEAHINSSVQEPITISLDVTKAKYIFFSLVQNCITFFKAKLPNSTLGK